MKTLKVKLALAVAALLTMSLGLFANPAATPVAQADPANVLLMNLGICLAGIPNVTSLSTDKIQGCALNNLVYDKAGAGDTDLVNIANLLGDGDGKVEPSDFAGPVEFTGGQLHRQDDGIGISHLAVLAFVKSVGPVTFHTTAGYFLESGTAIWSCNGSNPSNQDSDCGGPNSSPNPANPKMQPDGVVVANLACDTTTCPTRGDFELTVEQGGIVYPVPFKVVGEPRTVEFFTLETGIQAGVQNDPSTGEPDCPFSASVSFVTKAVAQAEKTVIVARALDIDGTAISGAWFDMTSSDTSEGVLALSQAPTLNLGGFGYGAPTILCAPADAKKGSVTITARLIRSILGGQIAVDPQADRGTTGPLAAGEVTFDVAAAPAAMTLTAAPAEIPCDGTATSTVTATLMDDAGNPAIGGTAVHFDMQVLGTANPIDTTTNGDGVATSTITPFSGVARGVPVTVSVLSGGAELPDLTQSILVQCSGAEAAATAPAGGGAPPPGGQGAPSGTIAPPNTGDGAAAAGAGRLSWWPFVGLAVGTLFLLPVRLLGGRVARRER